MLEIFDLNFHCRAANFLAIGTQWSMPLHPKTRSNADKSVQYDNRTKTNSNQNESIATVMFRQNNNDSAIPRFQSNPIRIKSSAYTTQMPLVESVKL